MLTRCLSYTAIRRFPLLFPFPPTPQGPTNILHVGNVPFEAEPIDIERIFLRFGQIVDIRIPKDDIGRSRGFIFVQFSTTEQAEAAWQSAQETPLSLMRRELKLDFAGQAVRISRVLYIRDFGGSPSVLKAACGQYAKHIVTLRRKNYETWIVFPDTDTATAAHSAISKTHAPNGKPFHVNYSTVAGEDLERLHSRDNKHEDRGGAEFSFGIRRK